MTAKYILGGISVIICYIAGNLYANGIKQKLAEFEALFNAVFMLKTQICTYSSGLSVSLNRVNENINCTVFYNIEKELQNGITPIYVIENSNFPIQIKSALKSLFECIFISDEAELTKAFSSAADIIDLYKSKLDEQYKKEAPLYRKLGLLLGISIFILLL